MLTLFNKHFYVAKNDIAQGEIIQTNDLEREYYKFTDTPGAGMILSKQNVVCSKAAKNISKGQLIVAADLVKENSSQRSGVDLDACVETAGKQLELSSPALTVLSVFAGAGALIYSYAYLSIIVLAFRKSILWGLSCTFVPYASTVFKLQNWRKSRPYFHALIIGYVLFAFSGMLFLCHLEAPLSW